MASIPLVLLLLPLLTKGADAALTASQQAILEFMTSKEKQHFYAASPSEQISTAGFSIPPTPFPTALSTSFPTALPTSAQFYPSNGGGATFSPTPFATFTPYIEQDEQNRFGSRPFTRLRSGRVRWRKRGNFAPTFSPTFLPSVVPTTTPTSVPTGLPTLTPTSVPTSLPTSVFVFVRIDQFHKHARFACEAEPQKAAEPWCTRAAAEPWLAYFFWKKSIPRNILAVISKGHLGVLEKFQRKLPPEKMKQAKDECRRWLPLQIEKAQRADAKCAATDIPTTAPTSVTPTLCPTAAPTPVPTVPTSAPTSRATTVPTAGPTAAPTPAPSAPTPTPSAPTLAPTTVAAGIAAKDIADLANADLTDWPAMKAATRLQIARGQSTPDLIGHEKDVPSEPPSYAPTELPGITDIEYITPAPTKVPT
jgi:hypothetical protein